MVDIVGMLVESAGGEDPTISVRIGGEPVDNVAWKRGQRYGPIVCDAGARWVFSLLFPDRGWGVGWILKLTAAGAEGPAWTSWRSADLMTSAISPIWD